jgi:hypothetical protein
LSHFLPGGVSVTLSKDKFFASGGEGDLYKEGSILYKLFHVLPEAGRIVDLSTIKDKNVIRPIDPISDGSKTVGYTYSFVKAKPQIDLYTSDNKNIFNVSNDQVREIIKENWSHLEACHKEKIYVVDYNANNLLYNFDKKKANTFLIDVLSFQTRNFPATALMADVEDFLAKRNFSEKSDYYSFYLHNIRMLVGLHPYNGTHPVNGKFAIEKIEERQNAKLTIFDKDMILPPPLRDFQSKLTKAEIDLYRAVFIDGERPKPYFASTMTPFTPVINNSPYTVKNGDKFKLVPILQSPSWRVIRGQNITEPSVEVIGKNSRLPVNIISQTEFELNNTSYTCDQFTITDSFILYTLNGNLFRLTVTFLAGKNFNQVQSLTQVNFNASLYNNVCIQQYPDFTFVSSVTQTTLSNIMFKELKQYKIYDAKQIDNILVLIATKDNITFDYIYIKHNPSNLAQYSLTIKQNCGLGNVNFAVKSNGVVISILPNDEVILFNIIWDNKDHSIITDSCLHSGLKLYTRDNDVILTYNAIVYTLQSK